MAHRTERCWWYAVLLVVATYAAACGTDHEPPPEVGTFVTYNTGLAHGFVDYATARMEPAADNIARVNADAICLQEVWLAQKDNGKWTERQIDAIRQATDEVYPHTYYEIAEPADDGEGMACTQSESEPLQQCVESNCSDVGDDQLSSCTLANCSRQFNATSATCQSCIAAHLGRSMEEILVTCRTGSASLTARGHNGLMLLSPHALQATEMTNFESTFAQRSALHAVVDVPNFGRTDVYCTQLAGRHEEIDYAGETYDSYRDEQSAQIDALLSWIDKTAETDQVVLMGDMGTGPAEGNLEAEYPDNYKKFLDAGFNNPFLAGDSPPCTMCGSNTLVAGNPNMTPDHIFVDFGSQTEGLAYPAVERIFDETHRMEVSDVFMELHSSDHYGIRTMVQLP